MITNAMLGASNGSTTQVSKGELVEHISWLFYQTLLFSEINHQWDETDGDKDCQPKELVHQIKE